MTFDFNTFGNTTDTALKPVNTDKLSNTSSDFNFENFGTDAKTILPTNNEPKKNIGEKVASFLGMEKFGKGIGTTISNITGSQDKLLAVHSQNVALTNQLIDTIKKNKSQGKDTTKLQKILDEQIKSNSDLINTINDVGTSGLTNKEVIGSALNTASMLIPGAPKGSSLLTKAAVGGAEGYVLDVGNKLQENKTLGESFKPGVGTVIGVTLPVISNIFGKAFSKAPNMLETVNQRLTPTEKKLLGTKGKEISQYIVDNRIAGTPEQRYSKITDLYNNMERKVTSVVDSSKFTFPKQSIIDRLDAVKNRYLDNPAEYDSVASKIDKITEFFKNNVSDSITASKVNTFKRKFWEAAYNEKGNKIVSDSLHDAGQVLKEALDESIKPLQKINKEYGTIIGARKLLDTARTRSQAGLFEKAAGTVLGTTAGSALGGFSGAGLGAFVGPKAIDSAITPVRSTTAVGLNEFNKILNKIPADKLGNLQISKKALIQLLSGK